MSKKELLARTLERSGISALWRATGPAWRGLLVFNYHRIGDARNAAFDRALWSANVEEFARQVRFLKKNCDVIRLQDLEHALNEPRTRAVLLTFDDGYRDNFELALPVLTAESATAVFFLCTGFLDDRRVAWWDEIAWMLRSASAAGLQRAQSLVPGSVSAPPTSSSDAADMLVRQVLLHYKSLPQAATGPFLEQLADVSGAGRCPRNIADEIWMTWDMARTLDRAGQDVGGHTVTHPVLARATRQQQQFEIEQSKARVESEIGHAITAFSYPVGQRDSFTPETEELLRDAGYRWAFSFYGGAALNGRGNPLALPRIAVSPQKSSELFRATARFPQLFA